MLQIGITGGIGSGKSIIARVFNNLGIPVYNADTAAKRLMEEDEDLKVSITKEFGDAAYKDGKLNRPFISSIVFQDEKKLELLNSLVHPVTIRDASIWMAKQNSPYTIKEAALLFESGSYAQLDYVIGVSAPETLRIQRVMERDHISAEDVQKRMDNQLSESMKMRLCDYVIINDDRQLVIPQVLKVHALLLEKAGEPLE
jgi:dephospho-CoA kinase